MTISNAKLAKDGTHRGQSPRTEKQLAALRTGHRFAAIAGTTHGMSDSPEFGIWAQMLDRCCNQNNQRWKDYGGRGIGVCEHWLKFTNFFKDMGYRPYGTWLDRIDNNGPYEPNNCRWATRLQQMQNTRRNKLLTYLGETLCLAEWARRLGINKSTLAKRISRSGWPPTDALEKEVVHHDRKQ